MDNRTLVESLKEKHRVWREEYAKTYPKYLYDHSDEANAQKTHLQEVIDNYYAVVDEIVSRLDHYDEIVSLVNRGN